MLKFKSFLMPFLIAIFTFIPLNTYYSQGNSYSSSEIIQHLKKLKILGSVLYIAAHPDDENTSVLTYMSKGKLVRTAYLALTRGDGGQNLLGKEKGDLLGVLRTQELLAARKIDGAEQYFTRAIDFGYSKTANETLRNWDKVTLLGDVVKVIREFQPDVILTRFSKTQGGHGHHLTSAILAEEAFHAAADPLKYPEQLKSLNTWQAKRLYWNTWRPSSSALSIDIGEYNSILGKSFNEISAEARSMHKSQGFGVSPTRGTQLVYFDYFAGDTAKNSLFDDIDISWNRVEGGRGIQDEIKNIINEFSAENPESSIPNLVKVYNQIGNLGDGYWVKQKQKEIKELIKMCSGLWMQSTTFEPELSLGEKLTVRPTVINRSKFPITLVSVSTTFSNSRQDLKKELIQNVPYNLKQEIKVSNNYRYSQPYWLRQKHNGKLFSISDTKLIGQAQNEPDFITTFKFNINGTEIAYQTPVVYKWNDAVKGEQKRLVIVRPELSISLEQETFVFADGKSHNIIVELESKVDSASGNILMDLPDDWNSNKTSFEFNLTDKGDKKRFSFGITPSGDAKSGEANVIAKMNDKVFTQEIVGIDYAHIPYQMVLKPAKVKLIKLDVKIVPKQIGYIMGSGDEIPLSLKQLGYSVELLSDEDLDRKNLSNFDVIICGVRAFNTRKELGRQQKRIIEFVKNGGTWIVQHNTRFGIQVENIGPYSFKTTGRDRIAEEDARLEILMPEHQIFNYPNKITNADFDGWVQERGLYFANSWEGKLYPLLSGHDEGETSKLGGLLYADYGKGVFIFTAYSWFRELPAGVPGAYRLFVNMISAKGK